MSVCRTLPSPADPVAGTFVFNRLAAMGQHAEVSIVQPVPYFPVLRPLPAWAAAPAHQHQSRTLDHAPMLYVPGVMKNLDGRWLARSISKRARELQSRNALDLIDAHFGYPDGVGATLVGRQLGVPAFVTIRGLETDILKQPALRTHLLKSLQAATGCISVSHALKDLIARQGIDAEKISVIPNAVDTELFRPGDRDAARSALQVASDAELFVSVGNLLRVKRHDVLLRAFHALKARHPRAHLVIVGAESHEPQTPAELRRLCGELGLSEAVRFAGRLPAKTVLQWLHAADVFTLASEREGCCNAVLEALATGLPVVATAAGDNPYYVTRQNGVIAPVNDVAALAAALEQGLAAHWDRRAISHALHAAVGNWSDVAMRVLQFFRERLALAARGATRPYEAIA